MSYSDGLSSYNDTYNNNTTFPFLPPGSFANCMGSIDGFCNKTNILAFYNTYITNYGTTFDVQPGITPLNYYAAGKCETTINGYIDWYLPAICQLDAINTSVSCPEGTQSIVENLSFLIGSRYSEMPSTSCSPPSGVACFAGEYWSSTSDTSLNYNAWAENFSTDFVGNFQDTISVGNLVGVRLFS